MNEELIIKLCDLIEVIKAFCALISGGLLMCLSFVAGGAIYDFVTRHDEHNMIKEARSWKGRGKYPPLPGDSAFINVEDEEENKDE